MTSISTRHHGRLFSGSHHNFVYIWTSSFFLVFLFFFLRGWMKMKKQGNNYRKSKNKIKRFQNVFLKNQHAISNTRSDGGGAAAKTKDQTGKRRHLRLNKFNLLLFLLFLQDEGHKWANKESVVKRTKVQKRF